MAPVGTIVKLTEKVVGGAFRVVRGAASVVTGGDRSDGRAAAPSGEWVPPRPGEKLVTGRDVPPTPEPHRGEQVTTEPHSPSRDADHGGPGSDRIDDWRDEAGDDESVETSVGTTGAGRGINPATGRPDPERPDGLGVDASLAKAVRKEAERMHRASEPKKH